MGFRFHRSVRLLPGVRLNFSKSGISTSLGPRGAHVTIGHGHIRQTVGIPGTGISYTTISKQGAQQPATSSGIGCLGFIVVGLFGLFVLRACVHVGTVAPENAIAPSATLAMSQPAPAAVPLPPAEQHEAYSVAVATLRQRNAPDGAVIGTLHRGAQVDVFETAQGWARISASGFPPRWVSARMLCKGDACAAQGSH